MEASRDDAPLITPAFETVWPDVERRLRGMLHRRGLDRASVDDVVQEVALRALANHVTYASASDLLRWAAPVACNLHVDLVRHRARLLEPPEAEEHAAADDVAREVAHRIELQRAFRGIAALRPADREAIIEAVTEHAAPCSRKEAVRLAVRRHRARSRLMLVLEQLAAWVAGVRALRPGRRAVAVAALAPVAAVQLVVAWHVPSAAGGSAVRPATVAPVVVRPVAVTHELTAARRATAAAHAPTAAVAPRRATTTTVRPAAPHRPPIVKVSGPRGIGAQAGTDPRRPDDHVLCTGFHGLPDDALSEVCVL
ncbi:MAG TPA: sigma-70 family RNA polymerase sigma factor [Mycobacteriales bacterium]|nr:sigma-70 family RNA polymerase sigma factor [Mycobacteriales bacterium]